MIFEKKCYDRYRNGPDVISSQKSYECDLHLLMDMYHQSKASGTVPVK